MNYSAKPLSYLLAGVSLAVLAQGCSSSDRDVGLTITPLEPIVKKSIPTKLGGNLTVKTARAQKKAPHSIQTFSATTEMTTAATYITNLFQNYFNPGDGSNVQGYLLSKVREVDDRAELFSGATPADHKCLAATSKPLTLDYGALNPTDTTSVNMLKFTLADLQCGGVFNGAGGAAGISGEVFGITGLNTSEWVTLGDMSGDTIDVGGAFIEMANLTNAGSTSVSSPETVNGMAIGYAGSSSANPGQFSLLAYKAITATSMFEMYFAANGIGVGGFTSSGGNGGATSFGPGVRIVSDGINIYADGYLCTDSSGAGCGTTSTVSNGGNTITGGDWKVFQVCLDAGTLAVVDPAATDNCLTLANSFTLSPNPTAYTNADGVFAAGAPMTQDPMTFTNITGDTNLADVAGASLPAGAIFSSGQLSVLENLYKISNANSVVATY